MQQRLWLAGFMVAAVGCATTGGRSGAPEFSDAAIAHVAIAANDIDIRMAEVAVSTAGDPAVREHAERVISDGQKTRDRLNRMVDSLKLVPEANDTSKKLHEDADKKLGDLRKLEPRKFDREFAEAQVDYYDDLRKLIDDKLLPNATQSELRDTLSELRTRLEDHLRSAKDLKERRVSEVTR